MVRLEDRFPLTPRPEQVAACRAIEGAWKSHQVIQVNAPTAFGKTALQFAIARWAGNSAIIVPNNVLLDQYEQVSPCTPVLRAREWYTCPRHDGFTADAANSRGLCPKCSERGCAYRKAVE